MIAPELQAGVDSEHGPVVPEVEWVPGCSQQAVLRGSALCSLAVQCTQCPDFLL